MENKTVSRKKPLFLRNDWHKKIKLGSTVKKSRKWRAAKGRHNKIRLNRKGHPQRPKIGWGNESSKKGLVKSLEAVRVENVRDLEEVSKGQGIIIGKVGLKKKKEIIAKANEMKISILNRYRSKDATK